MEAELDADERRSVKTREETRVRHQQLWLLVFCLGLGVFAGGFAFWKEGQWSAQIWSTVPMAGGLLMSLLGLVMSARHRPDANTERFRSLPGYRDRTQQARAASILTMPMISLFATMRSIEGTADVLAGKGDAGDLFWAGFSILASLMTLMMVAGLDIRRDRTLKRLLEDELTMSFRSTALGWGLVVAVFGLIGVFGLALWRADAGIVAIPLVLALAAAVAAFRFWTLNRDADPNG